MDTPSWLKPGLYGAGAGALALAIVGFAWGGWMTSSNAQKMASAEARLQVVAALVPICIEQSNQDPELSQTLTMLKDANAYERSDMIMKTGWATMPGSNDPNRSVARACMDQIAGKF